MNSLKIEATLSTPEVNFDADNNTLSISKISKPEDAIGFYKPVFVFIDSFVEVKVKTKLTEEFILNLDFQYFNTATAKVLYDLIIRLKELIELGVNLIINWLYLTDDEDSLEEGEIMSDALDIAFNFVLVERQK